MACKPQQLFCRWRVLTADVGAPLCGCLGPAAPLWVRTLNRSMRLAGRWDVGVTLHLTYLYPWRLAGVTPSRGTPPMGAISDLHLLVQTMHFLDYHPDPLTSGALAAFPPAAQLIPQPSLTLHSLPCALLSRLYGFLINCHGETRVWLVLPRFKTWCRQVQLERLLCFSALPKNASPCGHSWIFCCRRFYDNFLIEFFSCILLWPYFTEVISVMGL